MTIHANSGRIPRKRPVLLAVLVLMFATGALLLFAAQDAHEAMAASQTINLNTGYDQWLASPIGVGQKDNEWRVIGDPTSTLPDPSLATGRAADVVNHPYGVPLGFPNSRWISINPTGNPGTLASPTPFEYAFYFTLPPGFSSPNLTMMKLYGDDDVTNVTLGRANSTSPPCTLHTGQGGSGSTISSTNPACFNSGPNVNELIVTVEDTAKVITSLIVAGTVTYECCDRPAVKDIPDLASITFWESTFAAPTATTFNKNDPLLSARLALPYTSPDFASLPGAEMYDFFYSDWDGTLNPAGQFVTIEALAPGHAPPCCLPSGGGLNIAAVQLNFNSGAVRFADSVASFVVLGDNAMPSIVGNAVDDGVLSTDTTMGNTSAPLPAPQRLRLTVGFPCNCTAPPSGMVAWWPLDETSGSLVRDIWGGHNGTTSPGPIGGILNGCISNPNGPAVANQCWPPVMAAGGSKVGNALYFWGQGAGRYVRVPDNNPNNAILKLTTTSFSIDAWVFITQYSGTQIQPIVEKMQYSGTTAVQGYRFYIENGFLQLQLASGGPTTIYVTPPDILPQGVWKHVAVTVDRSTPIYTVKFYIDGSLVRTVSAGPIGNIGNTQDLIIGGSILGPATDYLDIAIDELEIFNRVLPLQDVKNIYDAGSDGKCVPDCPTCRVGGTVELVADGADASALAASGSGSPEVPYAALAGGISAGVLALAAGGWYARRRWMR